MKKILSQEQLDELIHSSENEMFECFVMLNGGGVSPKSITLVEDDFYYIVNVIPHDKLMDSSPIGEAIKKRALYTY